MQQDPRGRVITMQSRTYVWVNFFDLIADFFRVMILGSSSELYKLCDWRILNKGHKNEVSSIVNSLAQ